MRNTGLSFFSLTGICVQRFVCQSKSNYLPNKVYSITLLLPVTVWFKPCAFTFLSQPYAVLSFLPLWLALFPSSTGLSGFLLIPSFRALMHSLSLTFICAITHSLMPWCTHPFIHTLIHWLTLWCIHIGVCPISHVLHVSDNIERNWWKWEQPYATKWNIKAYT